MTKEEVYRIQQKLQAVNDCNFLVMNSSVLLGANHPRDYAAQWANRDDCTLATPWGCYNGIEGVRRCYGTDMKDIRDEGAEEFLRGSLNMESINGDVVEVAEDLQTARGIYIYQRGENTPTKNEIPGLERKCYWAWGWYGVDFIREDGQWKIWHVKFFPFMRVPFGKNWTEHEYSGFPLRNPTCDRPPLPFYRYHEEQIFPKNYPPFPQAYKTFADVAPGFGYEL